MRHIAAFVISISVNAYVLPVGVVGDTVERMAACGTVRTSSFLGKEKEVAGPDGCRNLTFISLLLEIAQEQLLATISHHIHT